MSKALEAMAKADYMREGGTEEGWFNLPDRGLHFDRATAFLDALKANITPEMVKEFRRAHDSEMRELLSTRQSAILVGLIAFIEEAEK